MNKQVVISLIVSVSLLNIGINFAAQNAASNAGTYLSAMFSGKFMLAFVLGFLSISCMLAVYLSGLATARGILMMGAVSIIIGTLAGVAIQKTRLHPIGADKLTSRLVLFSVYTRLMWWPHNSKTQRHVVGKLDNVWPISNVAPD